MRRGRPLAQVALVENRMPQAQFVDHESTDDAVAVHQLAGVPAVGLGP